MLIAMAQCIYVCAICLEAHTLYCTHAPHSAYTHPRARALNEQYLPGSEFVVLHHIHAHTQLHFNYVFISFLPRFSVSSFSSSVLYLCVPLFLSLSKYTPEPNHFCMFLFHHSNECVLPFVAHSLPLCLLRCAKTKIM